jgi:endonuclease III
MSRQISDKKAWLIPSTVFEYFKTNGIDTLARKTEKDYLELFKKKKLHHYSEKMASVFYRAVLDIKQKYKGNAANIWLNKPGSALVVYRFLEFDGCGQKIATMTANILARQFKIPLADYYSIDVSVDTHVKRVMVRTGLIPFDAKPEQIIYKAREINPDFPGLIDFSLWEIGTNYCKSKNPECEQCFIKNSCAAVLGGKTGARRRSA